MDGRWSLVYGVKEENEGDGDGVVGWRLVFERKGESVKRVEDIVAKWDARERIDGVYVHSVDFRSERNIQCSATS